MLTSALITNKIRYGIMRDIKHPLGLRIHPDIWCDVDRNIAFHVANLTQDVINTVHMESYSFLITDIFTDETSPQ